ncbi:MAG: 16S rRNA processing protein RimM [Oscillospiraceae bacterium]|nr:16S rRNA processing protein RimM [Oscillospiraceae bacterium]
MKDGYLEVGKIVNTHGIRGEVKVQSWCDSLEDLCDLEQVVVSGKEYDVIHARIHGQFVLMTLSGIGSIDDALPLKSKVMLASRDQFDLDEDAHFVVDLIGLEARDAATGAVLGKVVEIMEYPAQDIYVIRGEREYMIPDVDEFVAEINEEEGFIAFNLLEGM